MRKLLFFFLIIFLGAFEIDVNGLKEYIKNNPQDIKNRLLLSKYYLDKKEYTKAQKYIKEILKIDPKNKIAKQLNKKIKSYNTYKKLLKTDINNTVGFYYKKNNYKKLLKFFYAIKTLDKLNSLSQDNIIKIARVLMWEGKYKESLRLLNKIKNKNSLDYFEIKAYNLYYLGRYKEAKKYFKILYYSSFKMDYATKLVEIYYYLGEYAKAQELLKKIKNYNPKFYKKFSKKIESQKEKSLKILEKNYQKEPSFKNLEKLVLYLFNIDKNKSIELTKQFIKNNPNNNQAKILLAKLLSWKGDNEKALKYLQKLSHSNNPEVKLLLGKILAWQGKYYQATIYLSDVLDHGNKKERYEAYKMLAFIQMWKNNKKEAKRMFKKILKQNPYDEDAKESLMILNNNISPLIKKYTKLLKQQPNNEEYLLKLADFYYMIKNYQQSAYYYEKYLKLHPENYEIYKTLGDIYLALKNYYKGFGNWEYYANYKNTKEAYLELAKRYYWNGFNKEALKVLEEILNKYPKYKAAAILKAKILKVSPKFTTSSTAATIDEFYNKKSKKLLILADRAYFSNNYAIAADYYKMYLTFNPDDYEAHEKYAYTLEYSKQYSKAAGEFFLLMWYKKTPTIEYHYAYNLQKSGQIKKAKKIYLKLLDELPKPVPHFLMNFINRWKKAWESLDFKRYSKFYDKKFTSNIHWVLKKQALFRNAYFISVGIYDPILIKKDKNLYIVKFFQVYASKRKSDKGYKTLYIKCSNKKCKIVKEEWKKGKYTPYNENNSLKKYILQNLKELQTLNKKPKNIIKQTKIPKKETNTTKLNPTKLNKPIVPIKKETAKKRATPQPIKIIKPTLTKKESPKKYFINLNILNFLDNQNTKMTTYTFKGGSDIFFLVKGYNLTQLTNHKSYYYGIGYKTDNFLIDVFYDINNMIGFDLSYNYKGYLFKVNKENLVYSRRNLCTLKNNTLKFEISKFNQISFNKESWFSIAYEKINDNNEVITPQFYLDLTEFDPFTIYAEGWYQFNKQKECYYSPKKVDSNILGIKYTFKDKSFYLILKGGLGYSFINKNRLYKAQFLTKTNNKTLNASLGCKLSNSDKTNIANEYKSLECELDLLKTW